MLGREGDVLGPEDPGAMLQDVSLFDLITAFNDILKKAKPEEIGEILAERFTVADKIDSILCSVANGQTVKFTTLFGDCAGRHEIVCTFLALLELIRLRQISVFQKEHFGDIMITRVDSIEDPVPLAEENDFVSETVVTDQVQGPDQSEEIQKEDKDGEY